MYDGFQRGSSQIRCLIRQLGSESNSGAAASEGFQRVTDRIGRLICRFESECARLGDAPGSLGLNRKLRGSTRCAGS